MATAGQIVNPLGKKVLSEAGNILNTSNKLVTSIQKLNSSPETNVSPSLRSSTKESLEIITKLMVQLNTIEESLKKISRIKDIIEKENRNQDEKKELIDYAIENSSEQVVKQWLRENAKSDVFFRLVDLVNFIRQKLDEEVDRKKKEEEELKLFLKEEFGEELEEKEVKEDEEQDRKRKKIELIFFAHGSIVDPIISASSLLPSTSITDVLLYSPWNCNLSVAAAYSIAIGSIQPEHRRFRPAAHTPFNLPQSWNSMRSTVLKHVPTIMVSPVANGEGVFATFTALNEYFGPPLGNRYLITFLDEEIGRVPFFVVMSAISEVLPHYGYEATVHLAACLGKSARQPDFSEMKKKYMTKQYAYTVDNTTMTVSLEAIFDTDETLYNMLRAVFDD